MPEGFTDRLVLFPGHVNEHDLVDPGNFTSTDNQKSEKISFRREIIWVCGRVQLEWSERLVN